MISFFCILWVSFYKNGNSIAIALCIIVISVFFGIFQDLLCLEVLIHNTFGHYDRVSNVFHIIFADSFIYAGSRDVLSAFQTWCAAKIFFSYSAKVKCSPRLIRKKLLEMKIPPPWNQGVLLLVKTTLKYGSFKNCGQKHRMRYSNMKDRCDNKRRINMVYFVVGYEIAG